MRWGKKGLRGGIPEVASKGRVLNPTPKKGLWGGIPEVVSKEGATGSLGGLLINAGLSGVGSIAYCKIAMMVF